MTRALTLVLTAVLGGCAATPPPPLYSVDADPYPQLIERTDLGIAPDEDVLTLPAAIEPILENALRGKNSLRQRVSALADLFTEDGALGLHYETLASGTAAETFETKAGNCLSYTHLYIALARHAGLDARYREVISVPQWDVVGDYVVLNRHVAAYGEMPMVGTYSVDFGLITPEESEFGRVISDDRARAQHFNNRGAWALANRDAVAAVRYFNRALVIDPGLSYVWANLGTAYMRLDRRADAERVFRHALRLKPYEITPMNQLARLYELNGDSELAARYRERAGEARFRNPYVLFEEARSAREAGDLRRALRLLQKAVRIQPDEVHFLIELGSAYLADGQMKRAKDVFLRADALATTLEDRNALMETVKAGSVTPPGDAPETPPTPD